LGKKGAGEFTFPERIHHRVYYGNKISETNLRRIWEKKEGGVEHNRGRLTKE